VLLDDFRAQCLEAANLWKGCDWFTQHGNSGLNLQDMNSLQAEFMCRATSGPEAVDWHSGVKWLRQVEKDARLASERLRSAASCLSAGDVPGAVEHLEAACALEEKYRPATAQRILSELVQLSYSTSNSPVPSMKVASAADGTGSASSVS
jgi:hypothetical protein